MSGDARVRQFERTLGAQLTPEKVVEWFRLKLTYGLLGNPATWTNFDEGVVHKAMDAAVTGDTDAASWLLILLHCLPTCVLPIPLDYRYGPEPYRWVDDIHDDLLFRESALLRALVRTAFGDARELKLASFRDHWTLAMKILNDGPLDWRWLITGDPPGPSVGLLDATTSAKEPDFTRSRRGWRRIFVGKEHDVSELVHDNNEQAPPAGRVTSYDFDERRPRPRPSDYARNSDESFRRLERKPRRNAGESPRSAAGLMLVSGDRVLLALRSEEVSCPGTWCIPGGSVRFNEDLYQAALRESCEELGPIPRHTVVMMRDTGAGRSFATFVAEVPARYTRRWSPELNWEHDEAGWFRLDDLPEPLHHGVVDLLAELRRERCGERDA